MSVGTLLAFLIGGRRAILSLAQSRWTLLVGVLLVMTASVARNYDGAWLPGEPTVLLHGLAASVGNAFLLYTLVFLAAMRPDEPTEPRFWHGYLCFLGVFWMTAPMGWLYAIPYERWLSPVEAVNANLYMLAFVSVWRVALITRVLSVLFGVAWWRMIWLVMLFADVVFFAAASLMPHPVIDFMGGLRQSPQDQAIAGATFTILFFTVVSAPVWLVGAFAAAWKLRAAWAVGDAGSASMRPAVSLIGLLVMALIGVGGLLAWAQPEQRRRFEAERLLRAGQVDEAMREMSRHARAEYPPLWEPFPRAGYGEHAAWLPELPAIAASVHPAGWVGEVFRRKYSRLLRHELRGGWNGFADSVEWAEGDTEWRLEDHQRAGLLWLLVGEEEEPGDRKAMQKLLELDEARGSASKEQRGP